MYEIVGFEALPLPIKFQSFQRHSQRDLIAVFKTVGQGLFRIVDSHRDSVYVMLFNPFRESRTAEPENTKRRISAGRTIAVLRRRQQKMGPADAGEKRVISMPAFHFGNNQTSHLSPKKGNQEATSSPDSGLYNPILLSPGISMREDRATIVLTS
jgi:hypothetical protein